MASGAQGCRRRSPGSSRMSVSTTFAPSRTNRCAAGAHQLALDRSRRTGQQRYLAPELHRVPHCTADRRQDATFRVLPPLADPTCPIGTKSAGGKEVSSTETKANGQHPAPDRNHARLLCDSQGRELVGVKAPPKRRQRLRIRSPVCG